MDFWILLLNWVWLHYVSCALIHLNPYIPVISYHEDFTCDIMPWTRDTVRNWFNNWGWRDNNRWKFWSLLCFSYFIGAGILCSPYIYITSLIWSESNVFFFSRYSVNWIKLVAHKWFYTVLPAFKKASERQNFSCTKCWNLIITTWKSKEG